MAKDIEALAGVDATDFAAVIRAVMTPRYCHVTKSDQAAQNISAGAFIAWDAADIHDPLGMHDPAVQNTRITIPAGATTKVALEATLGLSSVASGSVATIVFRKNGAAIAGYPAVSVLVGTGPFVSVAALVVDGVPTDYFEVFGICNDTSVTIENDSNFKVVLLN